MVVKETAEGSGASAEQGPLGLPAGGDAVVGRRLCPGEEVEESGCKKGTVKVWTPQKIAVIILKSVQWFYHRVMQTDVRVANSVDSDHATLPEQFDQGPTLFAKACV